MCKRILLPIFLLLTACGAHTEAAPTYRYADWVRNPEAARAIRERPAILEFQPGARLPVELAFSDALFGLEPSPPNLALVAREHCFVRIDRNGLRASRDGRDFDREPKQPGSFFVGFT